MLERYIDIFNMFIEYNYDIYIINVKNINSYIWYDYSIWLLYILEKLNRMYSYM